MTNYNASKTHCKHGHEFTAENTAISKSGARRCRSCYRAHNNAYTYEKVYGITTAMVAMLFEKQNGICPICLRELDQPYVDHDHITGKVRGLLCLTCNVGLGALGDSIENLQRGINHLRGVE